MSEKVPTTSSQSILGFVTRQEPTAKTIVSKILANLISKVIDESENLVAKAKHRGDSVSEKQLSGWKAERLEKNKTIRNPEKTFCEKNLAVKNN